MVSEAIRKLKAEMDGNKNNPYIQVVGDFLLLHLEANPDDAEKIVGEDKTIRKSLDAMKEEARKKQHNGVAMLTDAEGFAVVLKYFGIEGTVPADQTPKQKIPAVITKQAESEFDVKLEDLL